MDRREYDIKITVNSIKISKVIIDPHYEENHGESVTDEIILNLVKRLNNQSFEFSDDKPPYKYFVTDKMTLNDKLYKLIWLLEEDQIYIGVVNAYRRG